MNSIDEFLNTVKKKPFSQINKEFSELNLSFEENIYEIKKVIYELDKDERKNVKQLSIRIRKNFNGYHLEKKRVELLYKFDREYGNFVAGVDEVGRGPLAGPIVAASVILDLNSDVIHFLNDSKKVSKKNRVKVCEMIRNTAIDYKIVEVSNEIIDQKGIAYANSAVLSEAVKGLKVVPDFVLSDGFIVKQIKIPTKCFVKGDELSANIAAASILAKVYRDKKMELYAEKYPEYGFESNSGYGSSQHIDAIKKYGTVDIHRKSFLTNILS